MNHENHWVDNLSIFFPELGKIEKSFKGNIQKSKNLFLNLEKLEF